MSICFAVEIKEFTDVKPEDEHLYRRVYIKGKHRYYPINDYRIYYNVICTCGMRGTFFSLNENSKPKSCPKCNTEDVVVLEKMIKSKMFNSTYEIAENTDELFIVKSDRNKVILKNNGTVEVKNVGEDKLYFDKKEGKLWAVDYRDVIFNKRSIPTLKTWLDRTSFNIINIIELITRDESDFKYLKFLYDNFKTSRSWSAERDLERALRLYCTNNLLEKLYKSGFQESYITSYAEHHENSNVLIKEEKKLHKIFAMSKNALSLLKKKTSFSPYDIRELRKAEKSIGVNNLKDIIKIFDEEVPKSKNVELTDLFFYILNLKEEFNYNDTKALTFYLCRRTKLEQGLDNPVESARLLYDYIRVMNELGFDYEKYPKSLKKVHDIAVLNKNALKKTSNVKNFEETVAREDYVSLAMEGKLFSILIPKKPEDIIKEGELLSHCVASYVEDVANGICKILFLRLTKEPETSYMTIEVRGNEVRQFRGLSNRNATEKDWEVLREWAKEKNIIVKG